MKQKKKTQDQSQSIMAQRRNILNENSSFHVREAYKTLRTNIRFSAPGEGCKKFCVTSCMAGEGKSTTVLNIAISFAEADQRVLLIDADLRRPSLARLLVEPGAPGLSNLLAGLCTEEQAIRPELYPNMDVIFSGEIPPNPSELLGSPRMEQLIRQLSGRYDYIFIDTPPVNIVTDACVIANMLDGVLFVVRQNEAEKDSVAQAVNRLNIAGAKLLGFILNGAGADGEKNRYSYERYGGESSRSKRK